MIDTLSAPSALTGSLPIERTGAARISSASAGMELPTSDFEGVLTKMITGAAETIKAGETAAAAGIRGQASVQQVVEAVMAAEQTLQGSLAIRDKIVAAYLELSRMPI